MHESIFIDWGETVVDVSLNVKPRLYLCESENGIDMLVTGSKSRGKEFVLLLDYIPELCDRLLPALINAKVRFAEGISRARSLQMETLLFAAGTMNASNAIRRCGIKDQKRFLAFSTSQVPFRKFAGKNKVHVVKELKMKIDLDVSGKVALAALSQ